MKRIREEDGRARFLQAIEPRPEHVTAAKNFIADSVSGPADGAGLIQNWWKMAGRRPIAQLILDEDYGFSEDCERAARHWECRLAAARALDELERAGHIDRVGDARGTERVNQAFTTVTPESGSGTTGSWTLDSLDVSYPQRVTKGPYSRPWTQVPVQSEHVSPAASPGQPLGAILSDQTREEAIEFLKQLANDLRALADSGELEPSAKLLIEDRALSLITELQEILSVVVPSEPERRGLVRRALSKAGEGVGTLADIGRLASDVGGLSKIPRILSDGLQGLESISSWIA